MKYDAIVLGSGQARNAVRWGVTDGGLVGACLLVLSQTSFAGNQPQLAE